MTFPADTSVPGVPRLEPEILDDRRSADSWERDLRVPKDLSCWPGHFPDYAIVPGVVQLAWIMRLLREYTGRVPKLQSLEAVKFKTPLLPLQQLTLTLRPGKDPSRFDFKLADGTTVFSEGRIVLLEKAAG